METKIFLELVPLRNRLLYRLPPPSYRENTNRQHRRSYFQQETIWCIIPKKVTIFRSRTLV